MSSAAPTDKLIERVPPVLKANNGADVTPSTSNNENLSLNKVQKPISPGQAVKSVSQEENNLPQPPTNDKLTEKLKSSKDKPTAKNLAKCDPPPEERKQYK